MGARRWNAALLWFLLLPVCTHALEPVVLDDLRRGYQLGPYLECLEDSSGTWTIEEVSTIYADRFVPSTAPVPNFGKTRSAIWARFLLRDQTEGNHQWVFDTSTRRSYSDIKLYVPVGNEGFTVKHVPTNLPFGAREVKNSEFIFLLPESINWERPFYYRVVTESTIALELSVWSLLGFYEEDHDEQLRHGLFYGVLLAMISYNLFIFFSLRDPSYLYYVLYISSVSLFLWCNTAFAFEYLWDQSPWWSDHAPFFMVGAAIVTGIQFSRSFLSTRTYVPVLDWVLRGIMGVGVVISISTLVDLRTAVRLTDWSGVLLLPALLGAGLVCWQRGCRPAKYFLVAWAGLLTAVCLYALKHLGIYLLPPLVPLSEVIHAGVSWEAVLLSLGLADRINVLRQERDYQESKSREAQAASQAKGALLANMSHELRTPMNAILGYANLLRGNHEANLSSQQLNNLEVIQRNAGQLLLLIEQLLDLSRLEVGRMKVVAEVFAIREVVEESVDVVIPLVGDKPVSLVVEYAEELPTCYSDRAKIKQIIVNVLSNAIKFTEAGEVKVFGSRKGGQVRLVVRDTGDGIAPEHLERIFEEFHQVPHPSMGQGTGLGLAITRRLCRLLGGDISVTSVPGQGSTFTVILPAEWRNLAKED